MALFFVTGAKQLVPIAIQLYQDIAPDNPVYLPDDPPFTWMLAKMWFNHADASVHQSITHFGIRVHHASTLYTPKTHCGVNCANAHVFKIDKGISAL